MKKKYLMIILSFILFALHLSANGNEISFSEPRITKSSFETCRMPDNSIDRQLSGIPEGYIIPSEKNFLFVGNNMPVSHIPYRKISTVSFLFRNTAGKARFPIPVMTKNKIGFFRFQIKLQGSSPSLYYVYFLRRIII